MTVIRILKLPNIDEIILNIKSPNNKERVVEEDIAKEWDIQ